MSRYFKIFITLVPVVSLFLVSATTVYYNLFDDSYRAVYGLLSNLFGFSLFWLPVYFYMANRYHLCGYTRIALIGLSMYVMVNILNSVLKILEIPIEKEIYITWFEMISTCSFSVIVILFILKEIIPQWKKMKA